MFYNVDFFPALGKRLWIQIFFKEEKERKTTVLFYINKAVKCKQSLSLENCITLSEFAEVLIKSSLF